MARFLPLHEIYSSEDEEDEKIDLLDEIDGPNIVFQKYYTKFVNKFKSRKRAKATKLKTQEPRKPAKDSPAPKPEVNKNEYDFHNSKRGMAVIINNDTFRPNSGMGDRESSRKDAEILKKMYSHLGFDVVLHNNLTARQMVSVLQEAASNATYDHSQADCFSCAILSHGGEEIFKPKKVCDDPRIRHDVVFGVDGNMVPTRYLLSIFNDECCPELEGKPRLFFIQACRGGKFDGGMKMTIFRIKQKKKESTAPTGQDEKDAISSKSESEDDSEDEYLSAEEEIENSNQFPGSNEVAKTELSHGHQKQQSEKDTDGKQEQTVDTKGKQTADTKGEQTMNEKEEQTTKKKEEQTTDTKERQITDTKEKQTTNTKKEQTMNEKEGQTTRIGNEQTNKREENKPTSIHQQTSQTNKDKSDENRGKKLHDRNKNRTGRSNEGNTLRLTISPSPIYKDFLLMYAAPPGYFAWRRDTGGWLIQALTTTMMTSDLTTTPLSKLLTKVSRNVATDYESRSTEYNYNRRKLVPCVMSMLTKDVYFRKNMQ